MEAGPARAVKTYQEVAIAISMYLEETADIRAISHDPYDVLHNVEQPQGVSNGGKAGGGRSAGAGKAGKNDLVCKHCHMVNDHNAAICPQRAADSRDGESDKAYALSLIHI